MAKRVTAEPPVIPAQGARVLIIEAPYYEDIAAELAAGALTELDAAGASHHRVAVPGALEIPQVLQAYVEAGKIGLPAGKDLFHGVIALGCVIRGETSHYDIVCNNANHWLYEIAISRGIPFGNAILTVDTHAQAMARASGGRLGKGADAARACLSLIAVRRGLQAWT